MEDTEEIAWEEKKTLGEDNDIIMVHDIICFER